MLLAVASVVLLVSLAVVAAGQFMIGYAAAEAAADAAALAAAPVTFRPFGATG
ncbi:MAG: histidine kinase, partial [Acidimicrobiia bacterium]|nr:histidine kinase [Acidimicrobiia bacterium]